MFDACYHPVRPPGAVLLMAAPHLVTADPVDANYIALALNLAFFALCVAALGAILIRDRFLLPRWGGRKRILGALVFLALLLNFIGHIPMRLAAPPDGLLKLIEAMYNSPYATIGGLYWTKGEYGSR